MDGPNDICLAYNYINIIYLFINSFIYILYSMNDFLLHCVCWLRNSNGESLFTGKSAVAILRGWLSVCTYLYIKQLFRHQYFKRKQ